MSKPAIRTLATLTVDESLAYLEAANGDELDAASLLARDRNLLAGSSSTPDDTEVDHARHRRRLSEYPRHGRRAAIERE